MILIETMLGRLGSRFTIHFLPREKQVRLSPLGKYYDLPYHLTLGFKVGETTRVLPFAGPEAETFPEVEMELTMTSVTFRARDRNLGLAATFKFISPFYPKDEKLCTAPFFYLDITLDSVPHEKPVEFVAELKLIEGEAQSVSDLSSRHVGGRILNGGIIQADYSQIKSHWGPRPPTDSLSEKTYTAPITFSLYNSAVSSVVFKGKDGISLITPASEPSYNRGLRSGAEINLLLATFVSEPVLEIKNNLYLFKYMSHFPNGTDLFHYIIEKRDEVLAKTTNFDNLLLHSSFGKAKTDFIAFTFQSYLANTWWTYPQSFLFDNNSTIFNPQPPTPAQDWFSVWEGNCTFHSTVDVEYNLAWIYLLFWPELLEKTISEWRGYLHKDERGEWMSHDIGGLLGANQQTYPHHMEVEENCNFILLTYALWRFTGRDEVWQDNLDTVARLVRFILDSDTTGNGFPDRGTANTVDDASPAVQFGREQTYLAVKALSACWAASVLLNQSSRFKVQGSKLEGESSESSESSKFKVEGSKLENSPIPDPQPLTPSSSLIPHPSSLVEECRARVELINWTLDEQAWLGDHFAVTLDRRTDGLINPWSGEPLPPGELEGWDAYSIYTANGLLYLLATDTLEGAHLPPGDYSRYRQDIVETVPRALIEYGCTHSSADKSHIWVSQNLHRDFVAAYLGEDLSDLVDRYWTFEQYENSQGRGGCFVDTYGGNHLRYYPRGITSLGLLYALAGLRLDLVAKRIQFKPVHVPLRVPIPTLADWSSGRVPWVNFRLEGDRVIMELENKDLLEGLTIDLTLD